MTEKVKKIDKKGANKKRSKTLTKLKIDNMELAKKIDHYLKTAEIDSCNRDLAEKLSTSIQKCGHHTLYAASGQGIELISSITCNHKICNICNWSRQKKIRRKYFRWFSENRNLVYLKKNDTVKVTTKGQLKKYEVKGYELKYNVEYDLMHLTLTVPHTIAGWKDNKFYFADLKTAFNYMRKTDEWTSLVYGGEYGIESTKNKNGFHIHIHALLFVKKQTQSRNLLHKEIMRIWNRLTAWEGSERKEFTKEQIIAITKGNQLINEEFAATLDPSGTTFINLETIYTVDKSNNSKVRSFEFNSEAMLFAVMETISYHFAPKMFQITETFTDIENIVEILPAIYRQSLYFKFGCLHGEKSLNVKDDSLLEDYEETACYDEETGEVFDRSFFITNPANLYHDKEGNIKIKRAKERYINKLDAQSGREALERMLNIVYPNS